MYQAQNFSCLASPGAPGKRRGHARTRARPPLMTAALQRTVTSALRKGSEAMAVGLPKSLHGRGSRQPQRLGREWLAVEWADRAICPLRGAWS